MRASGAGAAGLRRRRRRLDALALRVDGSAAAPGTVQRERGVLVNVAEYAVERRLLSHNPITRLPRKAPRVVAAVDRRVVVDPERARALLVVVAEQKPSGPALVAFFGAMYYAALRPGEASTVRKSNLLLPVAGWGELLLESSPRRPARRGPTAAGAARSVHSLAVLLQIYAKCLVGQEEAARQRIDAVIGGSNA